jgi:hypothetical protein
VWKPLIRSHCCSHCPATAAAFATISPFLICVTSSAALLMMRIKSRQGRPTVQHQEAAQEDKTACSHRRSCDKDVCTYQDSPLMQMKGCVCINHGTVPSLVMAVSYANEGLCLHQLQVFCWAPMYRKCFASGLGESGMPW